MDYSVFTHRITRNVLSFGDFILQFHSIFDIFVFMNDAIPAYIVQLKLEL